MPKPQIITQPETITAVVGKDVRFTCSAASSSSSPMTFAWKKDNEALANADMENFAHVRAQDGEVMEYTTVLHLRRLTFAHEGRYQCVITNHFGSSYSHKAKLTVHGTPPSSWGSGSCRAMLGAALPSGNDQDGRRHSVTRCGLAWAQE